jgi:hypothetical protein
MVCASFESKFPFATLEIFAYAAMPFDFALVRPFEGAAPAIAPVDVTANVAVDMAFRFDSKLESDLYEDESPE